MSIPVEDWDDLAEARRRRDERAALFYTPPVHEGDESEAGAPTVESPPALTAVPDTGVYLDEDAFGEISQNLKLPAYIAGANLLAWATGAPDRRRRARRRRVLRLGRAAARGLRAARVAPRSHRPDLPGRRAAAAGHDHHAAT